MSNAGATKVIEMSYERNIVFALGLLLGCSEESEGCGTPLEAGERLRFTVTAPQIARGEFCAPVPLVFEVGQAFELRVGAPYDGTGCEADFRAAPEVPEVLEGIASGCEGRDAPLGLTCWGFEVEGDCPAELQFFVDNGFRPESAVEHDVLFSLDWRNLGCSEMACSRDHYLADVERLDLE